METVIALLDIEEGFRERVFHCTEGYLTIGGGIKVSSAKWASDSGLVDVKYIPHELSEFMEGLTGKHIENLRYCDLRISRDVSHKIMELRVSGIIACLRDEWFASLNRPRKDVIISMCYQMGVFGVLGFKKTIQHLKSYEFEKAADEMLDSKWFRDTPNRAKRHAAVMRSGEYACVPEYLQLEYIMRGKHGLS